MASRFFADIGKSPVRNVGALLETVEKIKSTEEADAVKRLQQEATGLLTGLRNVLHPSAGEELNENQVLSVETEVLGNDLLVTLVEDLKFLNFDGRREVGQITKHLLRLFNGEEICATAAYLLENSTLVDRMLAGYDDFDEALHCGPMLRECIRHEELCARILHSPQFFDLFKHCDSGVFDLQSDAFLTLRDVFTVHKELSCPFLMENYEKLFIEDCWANLFTSRNFVTKRQGLKILGDILLDTGSFFELMMTFSTDARTMRSIMVLLRDPAKAIQFEAFRIFKLFIANPNKTDPVLEIIFKNGEKLLSFLGDFHVDHDDETFQQERSMLIGIVEELVASS